MPKLESALVTGASSGMGKVIAERLLGAGMTVWAAARSVDRMEDLAEKGATVIGMDLSRDEDILGAVERIGEGGVDVLVNNAGFGLYGAVEDVDLDKARHQFEVNLFGPARLTQLLLPAMRLKRRGRIINISSMGGRIYTPLGAWYHASKHALEGWSDCLRIEVEPHGIDVVIVEPGLIETGFLDALVENFSAGESGAYTSLAEAINRATRDAYERGAASPPALVAQVVLDAIRAQTPRTRYPVGALARPLLAARRVLPDRLFDRLIMSRVK